MTDNIINIFTNNTAIEPKDEITEALSKYIEKIVNRDKSVTYKELPTTYFLDNDKWNISFFAEIEQFKKEVESYKYTSKNISFPFNNENVNREMKYIVYSIQ